MNGADHFHTSLLLVLAMKSFFYMCIDFEKKNSDKFIGNTHTSCLLVVTFLIQLSRVPALCS